MDARGPGPLGRPTALSAPRLILDTGDPGALQPVPAGVPTLAGFSVMISSDTRRPGLAGWLDPEGCQTVAITAVRTVPQPDPETIATAIATCVEQPMDEVIVSSAFGLRAWIEAARRGGQLDALVDGFGQARLLARDARAADGLRAMGFTQIWSTAAGTTEELFRYLYAQPVRGRRVVAHIESDAERELCEHLRRQGATVVEVPTTQALPPPHSDVLRRQCDLIRRHQVDAVVLVGPAATQHLLERAVKDDVLDDVLNAFVEHVMAVCLGPLSAAPLVARGVPVLQASMPVSEALAALIIDELPRRATVVQVGHQQLELRGQAVVLAGRLIPIQAGPMAVLRVLAARPGRVMSTAEILSALPRTSTVDDHAIEMAVSRLRSSLAADIIGRDLIQTVMRRGYRLAI